ncbi:MAG: nucleoside hydrolase [Candidatus Helarchaeota archaeon]
MTLNIIVDTDPGLGHLFSDVDDGLSIFIMLNSLELFNIIGFTICYGNTPVNIGYGLAKKYLKIAKKTGIPVIKGAKNKFQLGKQNDASNFIIEQVKEHPNDITLFTLAPLTNIATAFIKNPELIDLINEIIMMGSILTAPITLFSPLTRFIDERFYYKINLNFLVGEFNVIQDPLSASIVLSRDIKTTIFPLNVTTSLTIKKKHLLMLRQRNSRISHFCYKNLVFWNIINSIISGGGFYPHDTLVPIYKINPDIFRFKKLPIKVNIKSVPGRIDILKKKYDHIENKYIKNVCVDVSKEEFLKTFLEKILQ